MDFQKKYQFYPYNTLYPLIAQKEIKRIKSFLGNAITVRHFGSTAVHGLGGKNIIDLYVVTNKDAMHEVSNILQQHGYAFRESGGIKGERLFHQYTDEYDGQQYHVHVSYPENRDYKNSIFFRNYLRENPEAAREYERIKQEAVRGIRAHMSKAEMKKAYMQKKHDFIEEIVRKAPSA